MTKKLWVKIDDSKESKKIISFVHSHVEKGNIRPTKLTVSIFPDAVHIDYSFGMSHNGRKVCDFFNTTPKPRFITNENGSRESADFETNRITLKGQMKDIKPLYLQTAEMLKTLKIIEE